MYARAGFIYHVDSLVWEVAVGDIALCQFDTCLESLVCISHTVMLLVMLLDIVQYQQGLFACSRFNDNLLETALQGSVLLNALAILIERGGTDTLDDTSCQGWFQNVGGIHASFAGTGAYHGVNLIYEDDDLRMVLQFLDDILDALFKLSAEFGSCNDGSQVETYQTLVEEHRRCFLVVDELCQSFYDGTLSYARFTY